ncbi:TetR/AcrR family transcriptional regulator [Cytobacillus sp. Hz8]|uniref:TetR/AcrR family transcriptional regulator n=1 Tax=Cytobacillus sp. Hz8 TaxID=3347168 RepID=UPI0035D5D911
MNDRKQHVINIAHQLFINKGFQSTSIQDILEYSGISKGTFYNYFPSKNELLKEIFKTIFEEFEMERNQLLIGQDPSDIEIFINQVELQMKTNHKKMLIPLFEELIVSNDEDLKGFMKQGQLKMLRWVYNRFIDIYGEEYEPYLFDMAIMFMATLQHNLKFYAMAHPSNSNIKPVIRYCVNRIKKIVKEVSEEKVQLIQPEFLADWLPGCKRKTDSLKESISQSVIILKRTIKEKDDQFKFFELLDFLEYELVNSKIPRRFLIESTLETLRSNIFSPSWNKELKSLEQLIAEYYVQINE